MTSCRAAGRGPFSQALWQRGFASQEGLLSLHRGRCLGVLIIRRLRRSVSLGQSGCLARRRGPCKFSATQQACDLL
eukprot:2144907-Pyramimonas_sp.AAC.1